MIERIKKRGVKPIHKQAMVVLPLRVEEHIKEKLCSLDDKQAFIRKAIVEKMQREEMIA